MNRNVTPLAALALLASTPLPAQQGRLPVDGIFPDSSYAVVHFAGLDEARKATQDIELFKLVRATCKKAQLPRLTALVPEVRQGIAQAAAILQQEGLRVAELRALLQGGIAFGIGRPTLYAAGLPSMVLAIDVSGKKKRVTAVLEGLEHRLGQVLARQDVAWTSARVHGQTVRRLQARRYGWMVTYGIVDDYLMLGTGEGYLAECVATIKGKTRSIRANPAYRQGLKAMGGNGLCSFFLNTRPLVQALEPILPYEANEIGKVLGIQDMDGIFWGSRPGATGSTDVVFLGMRGNDKGILKALLRKPASQRAARFCAEDSVFFATASLDPKAFAEACQTMLRFLPAEARSELEREFRREVLRELDRELKHGGMRLKDLLAICEPFGTEFTLAATMPLQHGALPEVLAFVSVKDAAAAEERLLGFLRPRLKGRGMPRLRTREHGGKRVHYLSSVEAPVNPAFTFSNGMMIIGLMRADVERALARAGGTKSLAKNPEFRRAAQEAGPSSVFLHARLGDMVAPFWRLARPHVHCMMEGAMQNISKNGNGLALDVLPTAKELGHALGDWTMSGIMAEGGCRYTERNPIGTANMLAFAGWSLDWFLDQVEVMQERGVGMK